MYCVFYKWTSDNIAYIAYIAYIALRILRNIALRCVALRCVFYSKPLPAGTAKLVGCTMNHGRFPSGFPTQIP